MASAKSALLLYFGEAARRKCHCEINVMIAPQIIQSKQAAWCQQYRENGHHEKLM
jgi:hypothetical protein